MCRAPKPHLVSRVVTTNNPLAVILVLWQGAYLHLDSDQFLTTGGPSSRISAFRHMPDLAARQLRSHRLRRTLQHPPNKTLAQ